MGSPPLDSLTNYSFRYNGRPMVCNTVGLPVCGLDFVFTISYDLGGPRQVSTLSQWA